MNESVHELEENIISPESMQFLSLHVCSVVSACSEHTPCREYIVLRYIVGQELWGECDSNSLHSQVAKRGGGGGGGGNGSNESTWSGLMPLITLTIGHY